MSVRTQRLGGQIQQELAAMLLRGELKDPRLTGMVNISGVEVTRDLQLATIFFSVMGEGDEPAAVLAALKGAAGYIRTQLAQRLRVRHTPELRFRIDTSFAYGQKIDRLLDSLEIPPAGDAEDPADREG